MRIILPLYWLFHTVSHLNSKIYRLCSDGVDWGEHRFLCVEIKFLEGCVYYVFGNGMKLHTLYCLMLFHLFGRHWRMHRANANMGICQVLKKSIWKVCIFICLCVCFRRCWLKSVRNMIFKYLFFKYYFRLTAKYELYVIQRNDTKERIDRIESVVVSYRVFTLALHYHKMFNLNRWRNMTFFLQIIGQFSWNTETINTIHD